jgi:hypothetical protein
MVMAIRCLFLTPNEVSPCQVLDAIGAQPLQPKTQAQLQGRYCMSGAFIACPIFARVEAGLTEANRLRSRRADCPVELAS